MAGCGASLHGSDRNDPAAAAGGECADDAAAHADAVNAAHQANDEKGY
jgi:hypothetical protein